MKVWGQLAAGMAVFLLGGGLAFSQVQEEAPTEKRERPFYEYPGNYREKVNALKAKFREAFGYRLLDLDEGWRPDEIQKLHAAFEELPEGFYRLPGLESFYRRSRFAGAPASISPEEIPAAARPSFRLIYEPVEQTYKVFVDDEDLRLEFYNPLFYEEPEDFRNIVHHEMAHAMDVSRGFLSFSKEWITLSQFRVLNLPALDHHPGASFLYTFMDEPQVQHYAPVAERHLPTYSRTSLQEDFANSVAAYLHYPYFQSSHPERYEFLKKKVFGGEEFFPREQGEKPFQDIVLSDFEAARKQGDWSRVRSILQEVGRGYYPDLETLLVNDLFEAAGQTPERERDHQLVLASCYLKAPGGLRFRRELLREKRVNLERVLQFPRCRQKARDNFAGNLVRWKMSHIYYYREKGRDLLKFLDPVLLVAHARGYDTRYHWAVFFEGGERVPVAQGVLTVREGGNGSIQIDLQNTARKPVSLPEKRPLLLELIAERQNPRTFQRFRSEPSTIRFVIHPEFDYLGPDPPPLRVVYPIRPSFQHLN